MFRILAFLSKREGLSAEEFRAYYENHHVPLILSLAPTPPLYKRRYLREDEKLAGTGGVGFDVVTELGFPDRAAHRAWFRKLWGPGAGERVATDEARFLDRSRTVAYVVDERVTSEG